MCRRCRPDGGNSAFSHMLVRAPADPAWRARVPRVAAPADRRNPGQEGTRTSRNPGGGGAPPDDQRRLAIVAAPGDLVRAFREADPVGKAGIPLPTAPACRGQVKRRTATVPGAPARDACPIRSASGHRGGCRSAARWSSATAARPAAHAAHGRAAPGGPSGWDTSCQRTVSSFSRSRIRHWSRPASPPGLSKSAASQQHRSPSSIGYSPMAISPDKRAHFIRPPRRAHAGSSPHDYHRNRGLKMDQRNTTAQQHLGMSLRGLQSLHSATRGGPGEVDQVIQTGNQESHRYLVGHYLRCDPWYRRALDDRYRGFRPVAGQGDGT